ncbi:hypothetical protein EST38_g3724 [Candolleomyces aberdarensis]|uniref:C2H2-type domain-containing protein n=1 Tax=Candolleomyces aberdarensis TaxID=2316362 RepID=A0A4Q2DTE8_9AGAR|nr:hypothetical protein EST38_g3724 [Candolleomyces aberdarensis]
MHQPMQYKPPNVVGCTDCEDDVCPVSDELTAQCTEQCVVIACSDPEHNCGGQRNQVHCTLGCDGDTNCADCNGFDAFLQCCTDYHSYLSEPQWNRQHVAPASQQLVNGHTDALWCDCPGQTPQAVPQATQQHQNGLSAVPPVSGEALSTSHPYPTPSLPEKCMWHNCKASFSCLSELVGHVNLVHLRPLPGAQPNQSHAPGQSVGPQNGAAKDANAAASSKSPVSCLWDSCSHYLSPENIAGTSNSSEFTNLLSALESHLLHDHLGLQTAPSQISPAAAAAVTPPGHHFYANGNGTPYSHTSSSASTNDMISDVYSSQSSEAPMTPQITPAQVHALPPALAPAPPPSAHNGVVPSNEIHLCNWLDCEACFSSSAELTEHLTAEHVGGGKARYDCFWKGCDRHGERGFSSKQKICRHLQSHTGHRPFQCELCHQNFSEAATLQQHMRRHTQEKPYACDFPGCGKSFAIMGALTIHKRIHNGQKPFKCIYCERAFTESSNLSKHLRTHTGARPYSCTEPGCGKSFARPDQLNRHLGIHRKGSTPAANPLQ